MQNRSLLTILLMAFITYGISYEVKAQVNLPSIFGNNMVLQRNNDVSIWGTANPGKSVTVVTSWNGASYETKSDNEGNWKLKLKTPEAGGPYQMDITEGETLRLDNVLIGEVWVCSGQSNMERTLRGAANDPILGANEAILRSDNPKIRFFKVQNEKSKEPKHDFDGKWEVCNRKTAPDFSATGYFFGNLVQEILDVPVGLIASEWGGTKIQLWMDEENINIFEPEDRGSSPSRLFNGMINPMIGFAMRGVIWYQGESNRRDPKIYAGLMEQMVNGWRGLWGLGDFPFYYCQIAPFKYDNTMNSAYLREAQLKASTRIPNSGMVSLLDAGEKNTIHPSYKRVAGERLAYFALKETYGIEGIVCRGPEYKDMIIKDSLAELTFNENLTSFGKEMELFELAGTDKVFYPAKAKIKGNRVILTSEKVLAPVAARYAFQNFVKGELYNLYGIPASSFRTDDW